MNFAASKKKPIIATVVVLVLLLGLVLLFKNKVGDLGPAIFPPKENIVQIIEDKNVGASPDIPLKLPEGYRIGVFAKNIEKPRDLQLSPGGNMLVSSPSTGKVFVMVDRNSDGVADETKELISGLEWPHGLAFHDNKLFVADLNKVNRYSWNEEGLIATFEKTLFDLPKSGGHVTRSLAITPSGTLYVTIGSTCNVCVEASELYAAVGISDIEGNNLRLFAKGLRNSVFLKLNPTTGELWATENSRDWLGDDLPPEEINIIRDGKDYGWPYCYGDRVHDKDFDKSGPSSRCEETVAPIFKIQAHSAPLGLVFIKSTQFPDEWQGDLLVAYHGSWNRSVPTGYKIVRLEVDGNNIAKQEDFLTGFLDGSNALGRPVDLEFNKNGALFLSDDKANAVYKIVKN